MDSPSPLDDLFGSTNGDPKPSNGPPSERRDEEDDRERLRILFGTPRGDGKSTNGNGQNKDTWPEHNYNDAPRLPGRPTPERRPVGPPSESTVWEINEILSDAEEPPAEPAPIAPEPSQAPIPWPTHDAPSSLEPDAWLDHLAREEPTATTTEARLVRTLWGDPATVRAPLFDTTEVLYAKEPAQVEALRRSAAAEHNVPDKTARTGLLARIAANPRAFIFKAAGMFLGLKLGIMGGYLVASLL